MADSSGRWDVWHSRQDQVVTRTVGWYYGDRKSPDAVGPFKSVAFAKAAAAAAAPAETAMAWGILAEGREEGECAERAKPTTEGTVEAEQAGECSVSTQSSEVGSSSGISAEESDVQDESQVDLVPSAIVRGCPREVVLQAMGLETEYFLQVLEQGYFTPNR